jgi:3-carboxy-cis,cis-muconate cycloisomerase
VSDFLASRSQQSAAVRACFDDAALAGAMLSFEVQLAAAQAELNLIPRAAAGVVETVARDFVMTGDWAAAAAEAGTLALPLVAALSRAVVAIDSSAGDFVHYGSTSQDAIDTAMALCTQNAAAELLRQLRAAATAARALGRNHATTPMLARTLLQAAGITTFGRKAQRWADSLLRCADRIEAAAAEALVVSLAGASGDALRFGAAAAPLRAALARRLALGDPGDTWHSERDRWIALGASVAVAGGTMRKIARDLALLAQTEVGEVSETFAAGRGASTAMPQKRNPVGCLRVLAACQPMPGLAANLLASMAQEHERALGDWQAELGQWRELWAYAGGAAESLVALMTGLEVDATRCRINIAATRGLAFAEALAQHWATAIGWQAAQTLVGRLCARVSTGGVELLDLARAEIAVRPELGDEASLRAVFDLESVAAVVAQRMLN